MKRLSVILLVFISLQGFSQTQSKEEQIRETLQNYIDGSSYNKLGLLKSAFSQNATLYLTGREGFKRYTPSEYANFFKNRKTGEFNGRYGKILKVEQVDDIATAKVEISIPKAKMIYIDLFLLKEIDGTWKIISKTATRVDNGK